MNILITPDPNMRTLTAYDKYEFQLYTHPSGDADDGSLKLNIINLQFLLGLKNRMKSIKISLLLIKLIIQAQGLHR